LTLAVFLFALIVYLAVPTRNYYWDGVAVTLHIEHPDWFGPMPHPNHLLYTPLGWALYRACGGALRAIDRLQILSSVAGALAVALVYALLRRLTANPRLAVLIAAALAFSATWWKFSTNAAAYVPAACLLLAAFAALVRAQGPVWTIAAAAAHAAAMLVHQLAVLFLPAALSLLLLRDRRARLRSALLYVSIAGGAAAAAYFMTFRALRTWNVKEFIGWITYHSPDSAFSFDLLRNLGLSLRGHLRLIAGGRLGSLSESFAPLPALAAVLLAAALVAAWSATPAVSRRLSAGVASATRPDFAGVV